MKKFAAIAMFIFGASVAAFAADGPVSGVWKVTGSVYGNPVEATCTLKQEDKTLTGTCKSSAAGDAAVKGTVDGKSAMFQFDVDYNGTALTLVFAGALDDKTTSMSGKINVLPMGVEGDFTAAKEEKK